MVDGITELEAVSNLKLFAHTGRVSVEQG